MKRDREPEEKYELASKDAQDRIKVRVETSSTVEISQWTEVFQTTPVYWNMHMNKYIIYLVDDLKTPAIARLYRITSENKLILMKSMNLPQICRNLTNDT